MRGLVTAPNHGPTGSHFFKKRPTRCSPFQHCISRIFLYPIHGVQRTYAQPLRALLRYDTACEAAGLRFTAAFVLRIVRPK